MAFIVPPGGFAGFQQMTPASRRALSASSRTGARSTRRRRSSGKKMRRTTSRGSKQTRRPKFGSPAWQKMYKVGKYAKSKKRR